MGKNNRARRAAKAKQRRGRPQPGGRAQDGDLFGFDNPFVAEPRRPTRQERIFALVAEVEELHGHPAAELSAQELAGESEDLVTVGVELILCEATGNLARHGWQPAELTREVRRRKASAAALQLVQLGLLVDAERAAGPVDERWSAQLRELPMASSTVRPGWFTAWRRSARLDRVESYLTLGELLGHLGELPVLDVLVPAPGQPSSAASIGRPVGSASGGAMLAKIRKLLAQAESTTYEDEAITFTAKAQELMIRHAIDEASVHRPEPDDVPRMARLPLDSPYADAKSTLLSVVAQANRCRSVGVTDLDLAILMGHDEDLRLVEMLFTSLLVQAQNSLRDLAVQGRHTSRPSFRASFYLGFAHRIGERLESVNDEVQGEAGSAAALPVLRAREDAVEEQFEARFAGQLTSSAVRGGWDGRGHAHGRSAADRARLEAGSIEG